MRVAERGEAGGVSEEDRDALDEVLEGAEPPKILIGKKLKLASSAGTRVVLVTKAFWVGGFLQIRGVIEEGPDRGSTIKVRCRTSCQN